MRKAPIRIRWIWIVIAVVVCAYMWSSLRSLRRPQKYNTYVFGYGSLLNPTVLRVLFPDRTTLKYPLVNLRTNYVRSWLETEDGELMLGLVPSQNPTDVNGILIPVNEDELQRLDRYESTHYRQEISISDFRRDFRRDFRGDEKVYVYLPKTVKAASLLQHLPDFYVQTVVDGFAHYGDQEVTRFFATTVSQ